MKKSVIALGCLGILILGGLMAALSMAGLYNSLVGRSQAVDSQWAQVENVYQRRADLIPNLVADGVGCGKF